jgi:hypothetical protein
MIPPDDTPNYSYTHLNPSADYVEAWPVSGGHGTALRRIGWLDQRGRIWTKLPSQSTAWTLGCGSFMPLLFHPGD